MDATTKQTLETAAEVIELSRNDPATIRQVLATVYALARSQGHADGIKDAANTMGATV